MNIELIKQIMKEVRDTGFTEFSYKDQEIELHLKKEITYAKPQEILIQPVKEEKIAIANDVKTVLSPMVGTFYNTASPESEVFVNVGDIVKKGQIIGIIEAMKLMNEIQSDFEGTVVEILAQNNQMVEYNQPLLTIKES